jgi:glucuronate isomerase
MPEETAPYVINENYTLKTIKQSAVEYEAVEAIFSFAKDGRKVMDIIFRISDRDVALKYRVYPKRDIRSCVVYSEASERELDSILAAGRKGKAIDVAAGDKFRTAVLRFLAGEYTKRNWVMQLHYGCIRDNSSKMMEALGPDTGFDAVGDTRGAKALANLLNSFEKAGALPKTILYSLNQNDNEIMCSVAGCFQTDGSFPQRVQVGSAWWFNDHKLGMEKQLRDFANLSALGGFIGMLTDSRSFLSYARHEYFRRILCNIIGKWVENGDVFPDFAALGKLVQDISFNNANAYFGFDL